MRPDHEQMTLVMSCRLCSLRLIPAWQPAMIGVVMHWKVPKEKHLTGELFTQPVSVTIWYWESALNDWSAKHSASHALLNCMKKVTGTFIKKCQIMLIESITKNVFLTIDNLTCVTAMWQFSLEPLIGVFVKNGLVNSLPLFLLIQLLPRNLWIPHGIHD